MVVEFAMSDGPVDPNADPLVVATIDIASNAQPSLVEELLAEFVDH